MAMARWREGGEVERGTYRVTSAICVYDFGWRYVGRGVCSHLFMVLIRLICAPKEHKQKIILWKKGSALGGYRSYDHYYGTISKSNTKICWCKERRRGGIIPCRQQTRLWPQRPVWTRLPSASCCSPSAWLLPARQSSSNHPVILSQCMLLHFLSSADFIPIQILNISSVLLL